jgi:hypothetical protein
LKAWNLKMFYVWFWTYSLVLTWKQLSLLRRLIWAATVPHVHLLAETFLSACCRLASSNSFVCLLYIF